MFHRVIMSREHVPSYSFLQGKLRQDPVGFHAESVLAVVPRCTMFSCSTAFSYLPLSHVRTFSSFNLVALILLITHLKQSWITGKWTQIINGKEDRKEPETELLQARLGRAPYTPSKTESVSKNPDVAVVQLSTWVFKISGCIQALAFTSSSMPLGCVCITGKHQLTCFALLTKR